MDIFTAIANSKLGEYQKEIDDCNEKSGCDSKCCKTAQKKCELLRQHRKEMSRVRKMYEG